MLRKLADVPRVPCSHVTRQQAANYIGVENQSVRDRIASEKLETVVILDETMIPRWSLYEWKRERIAAGR